MGILATKLLTSLPQLGQNKHWNSAAHIKNHRATNYSPVTPESGHQKKTLLVQKVYQDHCSHRMPAVLHREIAKRTPSRSLPRIRLCAHQQTHSNLHRSNPTMETLFEDHLSLHQSTHLHCLRKKGQELRQKDTHNIHATSQ